MARHAHTLNCLADVGGRLVYKCGHDNPGTERHGAGAGHGPEKHALLKGRERTLAGKYIAEEMRTGKYPREQAIAIGMARARRAGHNSPWSFRIHYADGSQEKGAIFDTLEEARSAMESAAEKSVKAIAEMSILDEGRGGRAVGTTYPGPKRSAAFAGAEFPAHLRIASDVPKAPRRAGKLPWSRTPLPVREEIMAAAWRHVSDPPALGDQSEEAKELTIYADNDAGIHQREKYFKLNLLRKIRDGKFNFDKSIKLWTYLMDEAAKKYDKEFGSPGARTFSAADKRQAARAFAREFVVEGKLGNYSHIYAEI